VHCTRQYKAHFAGSVQNAYAHEYLYPTCGINNCISSVLESWRQGQHNELLIFCYVRTCTVYGRTDTTFWLYLGYGLRPVFLFTFRKLHEDNETWRPHPMASSVFRTSFRRFGVGSAVAVPPFCSVKPHHTAEVSSSCGSSAIEWRGIYCTVIFLGVKRGRCLKGWQPHHHLWIDCLDVSEPYRPLQPVTGITLLFFTGTLRLVEFIINIRKRVTSEFTYGLLRNDNIKSLHTLEEWERGRKLYEYYLRDLYSSQSIVRR
jgi:hypothetical protein